MQLRITHWRAESRVSCPCPPPRQRRPSRSRTSTPATTTSPPSPTTRSGGSTSARSARTRCARSSRKALGREPATFGDALEIGAGTGYFSLNLRPARRDRAADRVPTSRRGCSTRSRATAAELGVEVRTVVTEAEALPFADDSFDLVFGHAVLHHIPDLERRLPRVPPRPAPRRPDRLLRRAVALRRPPRGAAEARRRCSPAPLWRRALGASAANGRRRRERGLRRPRARAGGRRPRVRSPAELERWIATRRLRVASASAARSSSPTPTAGSCARSSRPPSPTEIPWAGATSRSAATSPCSGSTPACSSRGCRRALLQPGAQRPQPGGLR